MRIVDIHKAKTKLSRLVDQAARGEPFIIAKSGKPLVKVMPLDASTTQDVRRLGFMAGQIKVPKDFNRMGQREVQDLFGAGN